MRLEEGLLFEIVTTFTTTSYVSARKESGKKKGRKRQRPGERKFETEVGFDLPTSYKNVVVGSVSLYGDVPVDEKAPRRLQSRYVARMPEDKSPTLKKQLQNEVEATLSWLPEDVTKIFVSDAAQGIRKEIDTNPLFDDFEKIVDFFHATDHLSNAAEAIFGKENAGATRGTKRSGLNCWTRKMGRRMFIVRYYIFKRITNIRKTARSRWDVRSCFSATIRIEWNTNDFARTAGRSEAA